MDHTRWVREQALLLLNKKHRYILTARCPRSGEPLAWSIIANELGIEVSEEQAQALCTEAQIALADTIARLDPSRGPLIDTHILTLFNQLPTSSGEVKPIERIENEYHGREIE